MERILAEDPRAAIIERIEAEHSQELDDYWGDSYAGVRADIIQTYYEQYAPYVAAAERIADHIDATPTQLAPLLSARTGNTVLLKREDLQRHHSFKGRGAANRYLELSEDERTAGVVAASAGNFAQGVAGMAGAGATIFMPVTTPAVKVQSVRNLGASVWLEGNSYSDAYAAAIDYNRSAGKTFLHPFGDEAVIHGQGTIALEMLRYNPEITHLVVPIGGGGLIAGMAEAAKAINPNVKVIGVQYDKSAAMHRSVLAGEIVELAETGGFSDGTNVKKVADSTLQRVQRYVDEILTVSEDDIVLAINDFYEETRGYLEPAGALAIAGVKQLSQRPEVRNQVLGAVCSGANISPDKIKYVIERAAQLEGRQTLLSVALPERPGALREFCESVVGNHSIREFRYAYAGDVGATIMIGVETTGQGDKRSFLQALETQGYDFDDHSADSVEQTVVRSQAGGPSRLHDREVSFVVEFPERAGALRDFLRTVGDDWNITRFDYQASSSDTGTVLISYGMESMDETSVITDRLRQTGFEATRIIPPRLMRSAGRLTTSVA